MRKCVCCGRACWNSAGWWRRLRRRYCKSCRPRPRIRAYALPRAMMLARTGQQAQAASEFNMAIQNDPGNTSYRIQAAMFFLTLNDPYQALPHLEAAVRMEPKSAEARAWYAQTLLLLGRLPEAQREIEEALRLNGRDTRILWHGRRYPRAGEPARPGRA